MIPVTGFIGGAYKLPSKNISAQRCVNLFVEQVGTVAKAPKVLLGTPGQSLYAAIPRGSDPAFNFISPRIGGLYPTSRGGLYLLSGTALFVIAPTALSATSAGYIPGAGAFLSNMTSTGPVAMADNGAAMMVVDGTAGGYWYVVLSTGVASLISDPSLVTGATHVAYLDGRFLVNDMGTNRWRCSPADWNGVTAWDPLAVAFADQSPDDIKGIIVSGRDVFLMGDGNYEAWYDAGTSPFPFARNTSIAYQIGMYAKYSLAQTAGSIFWLGSGAEGYGVIYKTNGYTPERISNHALEQEIRGYGSIDDAYGMVYQESGHAFYAITFQQGNATWCYDLATGEWHQRAYLNLATGELEKWRAVAVASYNGKTFVTDPILRNETSPYFGTTDFCACLNELNMAVYTECGDPIMRLRSSPHSYSNLNRVFFHRFQLDMESGVGLTTGQGSDPQIRMRYSNDAGHSWSNFILRSMGKIGQYFVRVFWDRLGQSRSRVWEISTSEPVPIRILGAWVDAEEGDN